MDGSISTFWSKKRGKERRKEGKEMREEPSQIKTMNATEFKFMHLYVVDAIG